jgi:hypothetical protein
MELTALRRPRIRLFISFNSATELRTITPRPTSNARHRPFQLPKPMTYATKQIRTIFQFRWNSVPVDGRRPDDDGS